MYAGIVTPSLNLLQSFGCDGIDRLTASSEAGSWTRHYGYDQYGNGWVTANSGVPPSASTPQAASNYNPQNQLLIDGAAYDAAGNQTAIAGLLHTHDAENRLLTSTLGGVTTAYTYDGDGRRVQKATGSSTTTYVYDAAGQLAAEYGAVTTPPPPCATCYLTADHLGSTRMVTDSNGTVQSLTDYLPFGEEIQSGVGGRPAPYYPSDALAVADGVTQKFTGKERDVETGLDYFGARYLSAAQGRFTSPDPLSLQPNGDPQTLNVYSYALNNPLRFIDDEGFSAVDRVNRATGALGKPYGGTGPDSYDCSGLAGYSAGTDVPGGLPRTAEQQYLFASNHSVFTTNPDQVRPGDEVYFQDGNGDVKHVGVVVSVDPKTGVITMVHAAGRAKGVVRATLTRTKVGSAFGSQTIKGYGLWHNYDRTQTGHPSTSPSVYDRVLSWWHSLSLFGESSSQPSSKPNPEGHPHRHKTPPCLKNADGRCVG